MRARPCVHPMYADMHMPAKECSYGPTPSLQTQAVPTSGFLSVRSLTAVTTAGAHPGQGHLPEAYIMRRQCWRAGVRVPTNQ